MNNNNFLLEIAQKGFRITVGAASSLIETVQNPQKRAEAISQIQLELNQKTQEWAQKGAVTEEEARVFLNNLLNQRPWARDSTGVSNPSSNTSNFNSGNDPSGGLKELTAEIVALRTELEKMRQSQNKK
ncbi:MAG: hypothetical protein QNJ70_18835 [Xenococcaceae cyanobacterium MO_207.B15]|nr:hypothetical protein [Xenococcaceae cyanobacterium MO_207.B15]